MIWFIFLFCFCRNKCILCNILAFPLPLLFLYVSLIHPHRHTQMHIWDLWFCRQFLFLFMHLLNVHYELWNFIKLWHIVFPYFQLIAKFWLVLIWLDFLDFFSMFRRSFLLFLILEFSVMGYIESLCWKLTSLLRPKLKTNLFYSHLIGRIVASVTLKHPIWP